MVDLSVQWYWAIAFGLFAGFSSALLGIGGGVILMPLLVLVAGLANLDTARGTALGYMVGTCLVGAICYQVMGKAQLDLKVIALLTTGGMVGAVLGMLLGTRIHPVWIKRAFALLMIYAAYQMFMGTFKKPESPPTGETPKAQTSRVT